ncbi:MAG: metallopeptidase family protein [Candidatus Saccharimonadales bacterium]
MKIGHEQFKQMISEAIADIPSPYNERLQNVAFIAEDKPTTDQLKELGLVSGQTLFGLYEGTPLPDRNTTKLLPDKITLFKEPLISASRDIDELRKNIRNTIWHEVAHYFGLDHRRIHELENNSHNKSKE